MADGIAIGATVALMLTRLMVNLLYKVSPCDPLARRRERSFEAPWKLD
jgi:hypothetical protein